MRAMLVKRLIIEALNRGPISSQFGLYVWYVCLAKGSPKSRNRLKPIPPNEMKRRNVPRMMQ